MIAKSYIKKNLTELDRLYNQTTSLKKANYYSKLATLELCGWIELTMDDIMIKYSKKKFKEDSSKKFLKKEVNRNYGFDYNNNLKPLFYLLIGIRNYERIERKLEKSGKITILTSTLDGLKANRNKAAHTYSKGTTASFDAPNLVINKYNTIYPIIVDIANNIDSV